MKELKESQLSYPWAGGVPAENDIDCRGIWYPTCPGAPWVGGEMMEGPGVLDAGIETGVKGENVKCGFDKADVVGIAGEKGITVSTAGLARWDCMKNEHPRYER